MATQLEEKGGWIRSWEARVDQNQSRLLLCSFPNLGAVAFRIIKVVSPKCKEKQQIRRSGPAADLGLEDSSDSVLSSHDFFLVT